MSRVNQEMAQCNHFWIVTIKNKGAYFMLKQFAQQGKLIPNTAGPGIFEG